jgi:hypothetical protein
MISRGRHETLPVTDFSRNLNRFGRRFGAFAGLILLESSVARDRGRGHVTFDSQRMSGT